MLRHAPTSGLIAYESLLPDGAVNPGMILDEGAAARDRAPRHRRPGRARARSARWWSPRFNHDYPLIRFATGDLSAVLPGASPCGRTNMRIKGWMGRADQSTKVRAMFVTPEAGDRDPAPPSGGPQGAAGGRGRGRQRPHDAQVRSRQAAPNGLARRSSTPIRDVTKLRGEVGAGRAGQPAERRQGDRGPQEVRLEAPGRQAVQPPHFPVFYERDFPRKSFRKSIESAPQNSFAVDVEGRHAEHPALRRLVGIPSQWVLDLRFLEIFHLQIQSP